MVEENRSVKFFCASCVRGWCQMRGSPARLVAYAVLYTTSAQFKVEDVFGDIISKDNFSQEQITKLNNWLAKIK